MKLTLTALLLSTILMPLSQPLQAGTGTALIAPFAAQEIDRRSGNCPHHPEKPLAPEKDVAREGSTCGGV